MTNALSTVTQTTDLATLGDAGKVANVYAAAASFADYRGRKSNNTLAAQDGDLRTFAAYLADAGVTVDAAHLAGEPTAWAGVTWGIVAGFQRWALAQGYSIASINRALSTVRTYAKLASKAGAIAAGELTLIAAVSGYGGAEGRRIDERREKARRGHKKAAAVRLDAVQVARLKHGHPSTPQGRRDALLMCLLLDHGLRVGEVELLTGGSFDAKAGSFTFHRPKVGRTQTHSLTPDTADALRAYVDHGDAPAFDAAPILRGSRKGGQLDAAGMSARAITERVRVLGAAVGVTGLSAHDCRHSWASRAVRGGTDAFALRDAGGWNSLAMPSRYVEDAKIANSAVKLAG